MSSSNVEKIKDRLGIVEVVSSYITLVPAGQSMKGKCPFHREKSPSFFVSPQRGSYYCFGCGAKGDIFTFVQEFDKVDFQGALKMLADRAGVSLTQEPRGERDARVRLFDAIQEATQFYQKNLQSDSVNAEKARAYLEDRGLTKETVASWKLGLALDAWNSLRDELIKKGWRQEELEKAGLIKQGDKGMYDRFRDRIMFPILDPSERVIAFTGRVTNSNTSDAKYLNSPDTELFNKSEVLYGFHIAKQAIREKGYAILVEGQMDLIMCHQAGFNHAIATSGTALTPFQLSTLKRLSPNLLLVYDGDKAGVNASIRAWTLALGAGMEVKITLLPQGKDPADLILEDVELFKNALRNSKHVITFVLDVLLQDEKIRDNPREVTRALREKILPYVKIIPSSLDQSRFIGEIALKTGVREDALWEELKQVKAIEIEQMQTGNMSHSSTSPVRTSVASMKVKSEQALRRLFGIIYNLEAKVEELFKEKAAKIKDRLKTLFQSRFESFEEKHSEERDIILFEIDQYYTTGIIEDIDIKELLFAVAEGDLEEQFEIVMAELQKAERQGDLETVEIKLKLCSHITSQLAELRSMYHKEMKGYVDKPPLPKSNGE